MKILKIEDKKEGKFLRQKTKPVEVASLDKNLIRKVIKEMRAMMKDVDGVGLSANQVGLDWRFFIAEIPSESKGAKKFYAIFNPEITAKSEATTEAEEGCLSVPNSFGSVTRPDKITLAGLDANGKNIKIKAWGLLARVFQHEVDHLNGILFIDKAKNIQSVAKDYGK